MSAQRIVGVDVARAVASVLMLQGHAYHGWASPLAKETPAYALTRVLGTFPLPAFLVLAGAAVALRLEAARQRSEDPAQVRRALARRGLRVLGYGYLLSLLYALMDGGLRWDVLLRADVLHVIGLGIACAAWLGIRRGTDGRVDTRAFAVRVGLAALVVTVLCPLVSSWTAQTAGPARYLVGLVGDVPRVGQMPLVPLFAWLGSGAVAQHLLGQRVEAPRVALGLGALALGLIAVGHGVTPALMDWSAPATGRRSAAIVANVVALGGHGLFVLALGGMVGPRLRGQSLKWALRLGRGSLFVYAVHIPFCYGRLAAPFRARLSMGQATGGVIALFLASMLLLAARDVALGRRALSRARGME